MFNTKFLFKVKPNFPYEAYITLKIFLQLSFSTVELQWKVWIKKAWWLTYLRANFQFWHTVNHRDSCCG